MLMVWTRVMATEKERKGREKDERYFEGRN